MDGVRAFKDSTEINEGTHLLPDSPTLSTLAHTWNELDFLRYFVNGLVGAVKGLTGMGKVAVS